MPLSAPKWLNQLNPRRYLGTRLALDATITVLILSIVLGGVAGYLSRVQLKQAAQQSVDELAFQIADKLDRGMFERYQAIEAVAQVASLYNLTVSVSTQRAILESVQKGYSDYAWIGLTNAEGLVVASTGGLLEGRQVSDRPWFQQAQTKGYVGDVHDALLLNQLLPNTTDAPLRFVDIAVPVTNIEGTFMGVLAAHLSWRWAEEIQQSLLTPTDSHVQAEIFILDQRGKVLLAPAGEDPLTHDALEITPNSNAYITGLARTQGYRDYPGLGWQVYVRQPLAIALAPARSLQRHVLMVGMLLGVVTALGHGLRSHQIVRPILHLTKAADAIRQGRSDVLIPTPHGQDEIAILTHSLAAMVATIQQQTQQLRADIQQQQQDAELILQQADLLNITTDAIIVQDLDWNIRFWNKGAERMYGWRAEETCHPKVSLLMSPSHSPDLDMARQIALEKGAWQGELKKWTKSGQELTVSSRWDLVRDKDGHPQSILCVETDITELKGIEQSLQTSQTLYESLVNSLPVNLYRIDLEGRVTFVNQVLQQSLGVPEDAVIGKTSYDFYPKDLADKYRADDAQVVETGQPLYLTEENINPTTGEFHYVEVIKIPIFDATGHVAGIQGLFWDITDRKRAEIALSQSETLWRSLAQNTPDYIMLLNQDYEIVFLNRTLPGLSMAEVIGISLPSLAPESEEYIRKVLYRVLQTGVPERYETFHDSPDGVRRFFESRVLPIRDSLSDEVLLVTSTDITEQKRQQQQLEHIVHHDRLTNLPNRILLATYLQQAMQKAEQHDHHLAVVYLDLDGFKTINDAYGHEVGDQLLSTVAAHMQQSLRHQDILARLGGDEFVAILTELSDVEASIPALTRLLDTAAQPVQIDNLELQISASLGVTFFPQSDPIDADQLLRQADLAMYQAKLTGKNCYHTFDTAQDRLLRHHHANLQDIRRALDNHEFVLYYQPQINARTGQIIGAEALIRWQHPQRGLLCPADFLSIIANQRLSVELGEWVLDAALSQLEVWHQAGLFVSVSVNVDAYYLQQTTFIEGLHNLLTAHPQIPATCLKLEILETSALEDINYISQMMEACQTIGVNFALDDFGTGYSSLTHLKHLPATQLKIDKSFVRDMLSDPSDLAILKGVMGLATAFRRDVIAEGVETQEHLEQLLKLGCELAQGYGIARPMPGQEFLRWSREWSARHNPSLHLDNP